ncbi:MAG: site-2 protease family protein [Christensenellaceae bacterium]|jgi:membrane-associated protease RseP (regulator of RpoE activity)|nr:site-2 protease family protein [Christensenellaceae bacterium]
MKILQIGACVILSLYGTALILSMLMLKVCIAWPEMVYPSIDKSARGGGRRLIEIALGIGPKIWSAEQGGTRYLMRIMPIGARCKFEEKNNGNERG